MLAASRQAARCPLLRAHPFSTSVGAVSASGTTSSTAAVLVSNDGEDLFYFSDGDTASAPAVFPAVFLRDNCSRSAHPTTLQRTVPVWELPTNLTIKSASKSEGSITVDWSDSTASTFCNEWLDAHKLDPDDDGRAGRMGSRAEALELVPWRPSDLPAGDGILPQHPFDAVLEDDAELLRLLDAICTLGVARVTDITANDADAGRLLAERMGHARPTVFGDHFEVRVKENPNNQAYTADGLPLHTDLPFYALPPGVQLLHAIEAVPPSHGGASTLADGLAVAHEVSSQGRTLPLSFTPCCQLCCTSDMTRYAASKVRRRDPAAYAALTTLPVCWRDEVAAELTTRMELQCGWDLQAERAVIAECNVGCYGSTSTPPPNSAPASASAVASESTPSQPPSPSSPLLASIPTEVNYNNGLRASQLNLGPNDTRRLYAGLRVFGEVLHSPEFLMETRLASGEALLFNNRRVLHGRTPIQGGAPRWLRGRYIELDLVKSRRRVLRQAAAAAAARTEGRL